MTTRARAIHLKHQQQPLLCKSRIEAPTGALGIRLFIRLFKIRLNSPSGGMGVCEGSSVREGLRANSSVKISSCVTSHWLNSLWHLHQLYLACSKLWWYGWWTAHCVNTVVKVDDRVRRSHWLLKWSPCDIYMLMLTDGPSSHILMPPSPLSAQTEYRLPLVRYKQILVVV